MSLHLFFDLDNTLLDHDHASRSAAATFQRRHAHVFAMPEPLFARRWHSLIEIAYARYARGLMTLGDARRWRMIRLFGSMGISITDTEAEAYVVEALADYARHWRLFPGTRGILNRLKPWLSGIMTNGGPAQQRAKIAHLGLDRYFKHILISDEVGRAKPAGDMFRLGQRRVGSRCEHCVLVGDTWATDMVGALGAGWQAIWIRGHHRHHGQPRRNGAVAVATLEQAARYIERAIAASTAPVRKQDDPCPHRYRW